MPRNPRRAGTLVLLLAAPVFAQFAELATTDDGSQLYFTTAMSLKTADPSAPWEPRIYRLASGRVSLFAERGSLVPDWALGNGEGAGGVSVSGDGAVVGMVYNGVCPSSGNCSDVVHRIEVRGRGRTLDMPGRFVRVSRDGRWALVNDWTDEGASIAHLVELATGERAKIPYTPAFTLGGLSPITSDGSVMTAQWVELPGGSSRSDYGIWKQGQFRPFTVPAGLLPFQLTEDGATVFAQGFRPDDRWSPNRIVAVSLATQRVTVIAEAKDAESPYLRSASADGRRVLWSAASDNTLNGPAYIWDAATGATTPVPLELGELAVDGVLTAPGDAAFIATTHARILRFDIGSKTITPLLPRIPYCDDPGPVARGSLTPIHCSFSGSVAELTGKIKILGEPVPVLYSVPGEIAIQAPWYTGFAFIRPLSAEIAGDAPFHWSRALDLSDGAPKILLSKSGIFGMSAVKGDWSGPLTALPSAGELFHVYMTGLGPLSYWESVGVPASLTDLNRIKWKLECSLLPDRRPVELLFAGIAPGMLGVYQTTFRMPAIPVERGAPPPSGFECELRSDSMGIGFSPGSQTIRMCESCFIGGIPTRPPE